MEVRSPARERHSSDDGEAAADRRASASSHVPHVPHVLRVEAANVRSRGRRRDGHRSARRGDRPVGRRARRARRSPSRSGPSPTSPSRWRRRRPGPRRRRGPSPRGRCSGAGVVAGQALVVGLAVRRVGAWRGTALQLRSCCASSASACCWRRSSRTWRASCRAARPASAPAAPEPRSRNAVGRRCHRHPRGGAARRLCAATPHESRPRPPPDPRAVRRALGDRGRRHADLRTVVGTPPDVSSVPPTGWRHRSGWRSMTSRALIAVAIIWAWSLHGPGGFGPLAAVATADVEQAALVQGYVALTSVLTVGAAIVTGRLERLTRALASRGRALGGALAAIAVGRTHPGAVLGTLLAERWSCATNRRRRSLQSCGRTNRRVGGLQGGGGGRRRRDHRWHRRQGRERTFPPDRRRTHRALRGHRSRPRSTPRRCGRPRRRVARRRRTRGRCARRTARCAAPSSWTDHHPGRLRGAEAERVRLSPTSSGRSPESKYGHPTAVPLPGGSATSRGAGRRAVRRGTVASVVDHGVCGLPGTMRPGWKADFPVPACPAGDSG